MSAGEDLLEFHLKAHKIPFEREFQFNPERRWRADFYLPPNVLVEVEGGVWVSGRHSRGGKAFVADMDKYNSMTLLGYRLLRFEPKHHIQSGLAIELIQRVLSEQ